MTEALIHSSSPPLAAGRGGQPRPFGPFSPLFSHLACLVDIPHLAMAKVYQSVPLDEEQVVFDGSEKQRRILRPRNGLFSEARANLSKHWPWLGHAVLLSISATMFMLSLCQRPARPSDLEHTRSHSSYCMFGFPSGSVWKLAVDTFTSAGCRDRDVRDDQVESNTDCGRSVCRLRAPSGCCVGQDRERR